MIQTSDNVIFDVKGLVHPANRVVAFPRYIPDPTGIRGKPGKTYSKVYNLAERFRYLQRTAPQLIVEDPVFGEKICEVPANKITKHYEPVNALAKLRKAKRLQPLERKVLELADELHSVASIPWSSFGISGSVMAGLSTLQSDIDPLVYGSRNCRKAYAALQTLLRKTKTHFTYYNREELASLFDFRSKDTQMSFDDFVRVESRKAFQGRYDGVDYFVRFVKDWQEVDEEYGDIVYSNAGYTKISAVVTDDSEALFTPCTYKVAKVRVLEGSKLDSITEVVSFRGRFCLQAKPNESVKVQGKVELVTDKRSGKKFHRIIIGNQPADFMALSKL